MGRFRGRIRFVEKTVLKVLTYNAGLLKIGLFGRTLLEPAPHVDERFRHLAPALLALDADLIALQEVYDPRHQQSLMGDLGGAYPFYAVAPTRRFRPFGAALMLFSKYPLIDPQYLLFTRVPLDEQLFVDKGMIVTSVDAGPFGRLALANVHNTSGGAL